MEKDHNKKFLEDLQFFGLTLEESEIYLKLIENGSIGSIVGKLKNEIEISRTTLYGILDRLVEKNWIESIEISKKPRRIKYRAQPPLKTITEILDEKRKELKTLEKISVEIGDKLQKIYQERKKITLSEVHPGSIKYLKLLTEQNWQIESEVIEHSETLSRTVYDYELLGNKAKYNNNCGLIIFEHERIIERDENLIKAAFSLFKSKMDYEVREKGKEEHIPDFEDVKMENVKFGDFWGVEVFIKFKEGSMLAKSLGKEWNIAGEAAVIPIKKKIFLIHGAEKNFQILMELIINSEKFHHLI